MTFQYCNPYLLIVEKSADYIATLGNLADINFYEIYLVGLAVVQQCGNNKWNFRDIEFLREVKLV